MTGIIQIIICSYPVISPVELTAGFGTWYSVELAG